jgi:large subunit ribosomal protein L9
MKVLLRRNVPKLGQIGEVVTVRDGYARNYLLPQGLALAPSDANLKAIDAEKQAYLAELAQQRAELETQARLLTGKEVTIRARANEEGHLYGSVGPAQIAAAMGKEGTLIDADHIVLDDPLRRLDKYDVVVRLAEGVQATIHVWIVPTHDEHEGEGPTEDAEAGGSFLSEPDADEAPDEAPADANEQPPVS